MCKVQSVRVLVKQQLTAAVEQVLGLFETTITEYEQEIGRLCRLLEDGTVVQQVLVCKEEVLSEQQDSELQHIKEEQEEVWSSQEGGQLQGLEEDDVTGFPVNAVSVESGPQLQFTRLKLKKMQTADGLLVKQHLTAAVEQIVELFERTVTEYEKKLSRSNEDIDRQRKLLDAVLKPEVRLHRADVQHLLVCKDEVLCGSQDPEPLHIKKEQEEVWSSQEGEQLQRLEEDDIKLPFTAVSVKTEDDEGKAQSSQLHHRQTDDQMTTAADGEDCGGSEATRNVDSACGDNTSVSSEAETDDSDDICSETREAQSHINALKNTSSQSVKNITCIVCGKILCSKRSIYSHMTVHMDLESFICPVCGKTFTHKRTLLSHMKIHIDGKPFSCSVCKKGFNQRRSLIEHIRTHTGEKPYCCSVCNKCFHRRGVWIVHTRSHAEEKPFSCSLCGKKFGHQAHLRRHEKRHSAEKPFSCSICGRCFNDKGHLKRHVRLHTGEKAFGCETCGRKFFQKNHLKTHKCVIFPTDP
ncbi:uncharacterized protein LOC117262014 isoform X1 [Epinephelus lanceolatus]